MVANKGKSHAYPNAGRSGKHNLGNPYDMQIYTHTVNSSGKLVRRETYRAGYLVNTIAHEAHIWY